jgi:hypothetical protein
MCNSSAMDDVLDCSGDDDYGVNDPFSLALLIIYLASLVINFPLGKVSTFKFK